MPISKKVKEEIEILLDKKNNLSGAFDKFVESDPENQEMKSWKNDFKIKESDSLLTGSFPDRVLIEKRFRKYLQSVELSDAENENESGGISVKKILLVFSNPSGTNRLNFAQEYRKITEAADGKWVKRDNYFFESPLTDATLEDVRKAIMALNPYMLHISMHASENALSFRDENDNKQEVSTEKFVMMMDFLNKQGRCPACVLISACQSTTHAQSILPFVKYAIGMNDLIPDLAAIIFAKGFYECLFMGFDVPAAFDAGIYAMKKSSSEDIANASSIPQIFINPKS